MQQTHLTDEEQGKLLLNAVREFIDIQQITTPEQIYQQDTIIQNSYELIEQLCEIAGYFIDVTK